MWKIAKKWIGKIFNQSLTEGETKKIIYVVKDNALESNWRVELSELNSRPCITAHHLHARLSGAPLTVLLPRDSFEEYLGAGHIQLEEALKRCEGVTPFDAENLTELFKHTIEDLLKNET